jgi:ABC-type branched-subunit amino acid transport system substrate-binding protein
MGIKWQIKGDSDMSIQMTKRVLFTALAWGLFYLPSHAQILIGQTAGFTGAVGANVKETADGAQLYIDSVNASGGVAGQQIKIIALDDKFDVKLAAENARILIEEKQVVALFLNRGTPHTEAILPILKKYGVALVAPSTGAMLLHKPVNRYVFNVRSTYQREAEKAVTHQASLGLQRFAVVHVDDSFGKDALMGAEAGFEKNKIKPVGILTIDRDKPNYASVVPAIVKANAQVVMWFGSGSAVSNGIKALRAAGSFATVVTLSNNASEGFIKSLGALGEGVIVTQVFPSERSGTYAMIRQAQDLGKTAGVAKISPQMLEGFSAAKVLVEGLRRAGKNPSRAQIVVALEGIKKFDLGGLEVSYSPTDHTGLDFADLSIIGKDGKFMR